jgi:uncharacterized iron-regulated protein
LSAAAAGSFTRVLQKRVAVCLLWTACALPSPRAAPWRGWVSPHDRDHPLAGRVIDVGARREIPPAELLRDLAAARFVLLGEKHDNPDHHRLQAWLIEGLSRAGQQRGVAFEMLPLDRADALARQRAAHPHDVDGIATAVGWSELGWPEWALYRPVFAAALAADFPVFAADLPHDVLARLRSGEPAPPELRRLGLDEPLPADVRDALAADLERSHCGALPAAALDRLLPIQRARDAQLAAALTRAAQRDGGVLIAGAGHAGRVSGVPRYLDRSARGMSIASVALLEVDPGARDVSSALDPPPPYDYLWFTPRIDVEDPCERFREQLRRLHPAPS